MTFSSLKHASSCAAVEFAENMYNEPPSSEYWPPGPSGSGATEIRSLSIPYVLTGLTKESDPAIIIAASPVPNS